MQELVKQWGKHVVALAVFIALSVTYFAPSFFDGKTLEQSDNIKATGMGHSQMDEYAKTAEPGEFSAWSDAMFGGMPYVSGYGNPAPDLPRFDVVERPIKQVGYADAAMVLAGLISFYILMCILGANWWLAVGGAIAFAFATYNIIIIEVGHIVKAYVIAYMPLTLAGMALLFKRNYLWGGILFLLGVALSLSNGHPQITYYLVILCFFIYLGYTVTKLMAKEWQEWLRVSVIMLAAVVLAVLPNAQGLYKDWELSKTSTRGATELTTTTPAGEKISSGLDKDYAFQWSYGKGELLTLLIPNVYGGATGMMLDSSSEYIKDLKAKGYQVGNEAMAPTYWGDKPGTSGPSYVGAVVCFLFVLGMFVCRNRLKWWLFAGAVFTTFLALGRNLDWFNDIMFHYLPMYNKFRTVEMALVIPGMVMVLIAFWGLKEIVDGKVEKESLKNGWIGSLFLTGLLCLIVWWFPNALFNFQSQYDALHDYAKQPWYNALLADRASMASADALRSLLFILATAGLVFLYSRMKDTKKMALVLCAGVAVLTLADLWTVDRRFLNDDNFKKETPTQAYKETVADQEILKDKALSFRVFNLNNPFQETTTSYYHHSIGGYHAVKLRRYQELIDHRLDGEYMAIAKALQQATTFEDMAKVLATTHTLNMLNTRYIIYNPGQPPLPNPFAYGNAWFVNRVETVENADAEMAALDTINPLQTAVVDKRFAADLQGFTPQPDSLATITLDAYRPNRLTYTSKTATEQLAVFSEIYYQPGWQATIDGKPAPHFRADWILRAMRIPAGEHTIVFEFRPEGYVMAANVSAYSSFLILLLLIVAVGYSLWKEYGDLKK